jgi:hypothetical protein
MEASDFPKHSETRSIVRDLKEALDFEDNARRRIFSDLVFSN